MSRVGTLYSKWQPTGEYDAIVIGSGIGGLAAAAMLGRHGGRRVLVLERHTIAGGFTHTFSRKGWEWDVGVHYIGQVEREGAMLRRVFDDDEAFFAMLQDYRAAHEHGNVTTAQFQAAAEAGNAQTAGQQAQASQQAAQALSQAAQQAMQAMQGQGQQPGQQPGPAPYHHPSLQYWVFHARCGYPALH